MNVSAPVRPRTTDSTQSSTTVGAVELVHRVPRTTMVDRIVMRIGVAMLIWSTRPDAAHTPHISVLADDPRAPLYARHAADDSLARGALVHGVFLFPAGR